MTPRVRKHGNYFCAELDCHKSINQRLQVAFLEHVRVGRVHGTHYFNGRYENLYVPQRQLAEVDAVLDFASKCAARLLQTPSDSIACGFWFNIMHSGDITGRHGHDDNDELLSAVYYVSVPSGAGDLVLYSNTNTPTVLKPKPGRLVLFAPDLEHEVRAGEFRGPRLSIGMNFGAQSKADI